MFKIVKDFFEKHALDWKQLFGICTDGAPSITGYRSGFKGLITSVALHVSFTCCVSSLCFSHENSPFWTSRSVTRCSEIVKHISANATTSRLFAAFCKEVGSDFKVLLLHTEVRWFSRGQVLNRLLQLREEAAIFLENERSAKEVDMHNQMKSNDFLLKVAYLGFFSRK